MPIIECSHNIASRACSLESQAASTLGRLDGLGDHLRYASLGAAASPKIALLLTLGHTCIYLSSLLRSSRSPITHVKLPSLPRRASQLSNPHAARLLLDRRQDPTPPYSNSSGAGGRINRMKAHTRCLSCEMTLLIGLHTPLVTVTASFSQA